MDGSTRYAELTPEPLKNMPEELQRCSKNVHRLWALMSPCRLCAKNCKVDRLGGESGYCGIPAEPLVSSFGPHFGEESILGGQGGAGTIFFAGCNLGCVFCQNYDISHEKKGDAISISGLANIMLGLQESGCVNINLVSPSHVSAACAATIEIARQGGLTLPIVYNSGGYDSVDTIRLLKGFVDIYMPDMKYAESAIALGLSDAGDYPRVNQQAVIEMHRQVGDLIIENGIAARGLLVRHLVLPNNLAGSLEIMDFLSETVSPYTAVNVMGQYRPCYKAGEHTHLNRRPTESEIETIRDYAINKGLRVID